MRRAALCVILLIGFSRLVGCIGEPSNPAATQPATVIDPATTQPSYFYQQPGGPTVRWNDFEALWDTCETVARDFLFKIDRSDFRAGVLTTAPLTSRQWFEVWRRDVRTLSDIEQNNVSNTCRTIRFEFTREPGGTYVVAPK